MRFRTDGWHIADLKAAGHTFEEYYKDSDWHPTDEEKKYWEETPKAEPGDVWRVHWYHHDDATGGQIDDQIAGYAICCIKCGRVHTWTSARNCGQQLEVGCAHQRDRTSCWTWSGSAEDGTLTASPSLMVVTEACEWKCTFHGYIQNGDIHE